MGSVISETICPNCNYEHATSDLYYKTGEEYIFCTRCGYNYERKRILDIQKTKKIYNKVKMLLTENKIEEAFKEADIKYTYYDGIKTIKSEDIDINRKKRDVEDFLKRIKEYKYKYFFKNKPDGTPIFKEKTTIPEGAMKYTTKQKPELVTGGQYETEKEFVDWANKNKELLKSASYTKKENNKWYTINALTGEKKLYEDENNG